MKKTILMLTAIMSGATAVASDDGKNGIIKFSELPFAEGKLYVTASSGNECIFKSVIEIDSETVSLPFDMSKCDGMEIDIKAFQDLNDNQTLDFDSFGRPLEPCLSTRTTIDAKQPVIEFLLKQY